jgi:hypothetical protein
MDAKTMRTMRMMPVAGWVAAPWIVMCGEALDTENGGGANANVQPLESSQSAEASGTASAAHDEPVRSALFHLDWLTIVNIVVGFLVLRRRQGYEGSGRPRRAVRRFLVGLVAVVGIVSLSTQSALASEGLKNLKGGTACSPDLAENGGWLEYSGGGYAKVTSGYVIYSRGVATVRAHTCDREDRTLVVSKLTVQIIYTIDMFKVSQCDAGLPPNIKCTLAGDTKTVTAKKTCSNASVCTVTFPGPTYDYPRPEGRILSLSFQIRVIGQQRGKSATPPATSARLLWQP